MDRSVFIAPAASPIMDDSRTVQWRRDASTSRTVRTLWALGVGTFFAAISVIVFWRLFDLTGEIGGQSVVVAATAALIVTVLALGVSKNAEAILARLFEPLPIDAPAGSSLERATDAALGTVAMLAVIVSLMGVGRLVSERELLAVGAGPFTLLAALTIPLALVALALASFLRSAGTFDPEEGVIHLAEPEASIDLDVIEDVTVRHVGDAAIVKLAYAQPNGQYVPGPRRLVVPPEVAAGVESIVDGRE